MQPDAVRAVLENFVDFLEPLLPMANCHMVDFLTQNMYQTHIPPDIRAEIDQSGYGEALEAVWSPPSENLPSLCGYLADCKQHTLSRFPDICLELEDFEGRLKAFGCQNISGVRLDTFASSKKCHEVEMLSRIACALCEISRTDHLVDVGDGKGYLSAALAQHNGMRVLGVDSCPANTESSARRCQKMNRVSGRRQRPQGHTEPLYKRTTRLVNKDTDLNGLLEEHFPRDSIHNIGLVGLHTCGDLAPSCLGMFHENPNIKTMCNVSCCYNLLSENGFGGGDFTMSSGFPLSGFLTGRRFHLGGNARMLAAQSLDRILCRRDEPGRPPVLFYRALLQLLLVQRLPEATGMRVGRCRKVASFEDYAVRALERLECPGGFTAAEARELHDTHSHMVQRMRLFCLIRAHLAPVIESVILLDRLLFLREHGHTNSHLVRVFDPCLSPRCYGLVAFK